MTPRFLPRLRVRVTDRQAGEVVESSLRGFVRANRDDDEVLLALREAVEHVGRVVRFGGGASPAVEIQAFRPRVFTVTARGRAELAARGVTGAAVLAAALRATDETPDVVYQLGRRVDVLPVESFEAACLGCGRALPESGRCLPCAMDAGQP